MILGYPNIILLGELYWGSAEDALGSWADTLKPTCIHGLNIYPRNWSAWLYTLKPTCFHGLSIPTSVAGDYGAPHIASRYNSSSMFVESDGNQITLSIHICCSPYQTINTQAVNWYILTYLNTFLMLSKFSDQFKIGINEFIYALNFPNHMFYEFVFLSLNNICKPQDMSAIGAMICACYVIVSRF